MTENLSKKTSEIALSKEENLINWAEVLNKFQITFPFLFSFVMGNTLFECFPIMNYIAGYFCHFYNKELSRQLKSHPYCIKHIRNE